MAAWEQQQIGVGVTRCPIDSDVTSCVPTSVLIAEMMTPAPRQTVVMHGGNLTITARETRQHDAAS